MGVGEHFINDKEQAQFAQWLEYHPMDQRVKDLIPIVKGM